MKETDDILEKLLEGRIPAEYANVAVIPQEVLKEMVVRLEWMTLQPKTIVHLGAVTDDAVALLKKRYPNARLIAIDSSASFLEYAKQKIPPMELICTSYKTLPFQNHSIDLVLANLILPWSHDLLLLLQEWRRVLRPKGLLMLTSFGPDTLSECHDFPLAFPHLMDMHTLGDLFVQAGFAHPVLDVDYFTLTYSDQKKLWHELRMTGMVVGNIDAIQLKKINDRYPLSYEVIFGHAFAPDFTPPHNKGEVKIPVSHILRR